MKRFWFLNTSISGRASPSLLPFPQHIHSVCGFFGVYISRRQKWHGTCMMSTHRFCSSELLPDLFCASVSPPVSGKYLFLRQVVRTALQQVCADCKKGVVTALCVPGHCPHHHHHSIHNILIYSDWGSPQGHACVS